MHALPFLVATVIALAAAPALLRAMAERGQLHANYRARRLPFPFGVLVPLAATLALMPLMLVARLAPSALFHPEIAAVVALRVRRGRARADRRHARRASAGRLAGREAGAATARRCSAASSRPGALKAAGSLGLALLAMERARPLERALAAGGRVLVLATNVFNLLDLRPGRSIKAFVAARRGPRRSARANCARCGRSACSPARRSSPAPTTCASGRCSATPARTCSARSRACGWCSRCRGPGS